MKKNYLFGILGLIACVMLDQYTKMLAAAHLKSQSIDIIKNVFQLQYLENRGAAFGMLQNQIIFFLITGIIVLIVSGYLYVTLPLTKRFIPARICLVLAASGGIGNMIDRVRLNYVIDFFYFELIDFPIFNVADIYVTVAMFFIIVLVVFYYTEDELDMIWKKFKRGKTHDAAN